MSSSQGDKDSKEKESGSSSDDGKGDGKSGGFGSDPERLRDTALHIVDCCRVHLQVLLFFSHCF